MLDLDDIQGLMLNLPVKRPAQPCGRYTFLTFGRPDQGRALVSRIVDQVGAAGSADESSASFVYLAFTCGGLRALGIDEASLSTFPGSFRDGMAAHAGELGDHGPSHPDHWEGGLASPDLHALLLLLAGDPAERGRRIGQHQEILAALPGVSVLSALDVAHLATGREHFGYQDGITRVCVEGTGSQPAPGSGPASKPGEFVLGYPDETGYAQTLPQPEWLSRNGSFLAYRRLYQDVAAFRDFLRRQAPAPQEQELLAAKLLGRWRSGAPLALAPTRDDPELAADPQRNNDFDYAQIDPQGLACPVGSHIRRVNPRGTIDNVRRRRLIRMGLPYGPPLPDGAPDDGVDRGFALIFRCADLQRQFEVVQKVWVNDPKFQGLDHDKDPLAGDHDGSYNMTIQRRPLKKTLRGLPRFTTVKGGGYFFLPGLQALRKLAAG